MENSRILIVEDQNIIALDLKNRLTSLGYTVPAMLAYGEEAVARAEELRPDLVLMDIKMPDMDGYEATKQIRGFNKAVIIIAQTAHALSGDREKAIEAGYNDYISKPILKGKLLALIQKYFNK